MNTNDPGREPEPTDAELAELRKWKADAIAWLNDNRPLNLEGINRVGGELGYSEAREFFRTYQGSASEGFKLFAMGVHRGYVLGVNAGSALLFDPELSGARPMPDLIHEDELPEMTDAEYAAWYEKSFIPGGVGCRVGPRPMPDAPAPSTDDPVCGATTRVDGKFRTCELPNGHTSDHRTTLRGIEIWWPVDEPNAPVIGSNQCEHGHLARVCVTCELIAAETLIARQSDLLTGVANALKGQAGETELWSHADLPEMATRLTARIADLEADLAAAKADAASWEKQADDRAGDAVNFANRVAELERENAALGQEGGE